MVMTRKRRNLLSKKRKNGKRNTKRSTKTRKNIRKMRGGVTEYAVGDIKINSKTSFRVIENALGVNNIIVGRIYDVINIDERIANNPVFELELIILQGDVGVPGADENFVFIPLSALKTCILHEEFMA